MRITIAFSLTALLGAAPARPAQSSPPPNGSAPPAAHPAPAEVAADQGLADHWIRERLPDVLVRPGPKQLLRWQWLALPLLALVAWVSGVLLGRVTRFLAGRAAARTQSRWGEPFLQRMGPPLTLGWALVAAFLLLPLLGLYGPALGFVHALLRAGGAIALFWVLWRLVDVSAQSLAETPWGRENPSARSLLTVGVRMFKVAVAVVAILAAIATLGFPVGTALAGLGLGGLAIALAAQKTVENLIGAATLAADQPFREGDLVKVGDVLGTVEEIGLRSTRIRTLDRTLVTLPNGRLVDMQIESYEARDRFRLACTIGLAYGATAEQTSRVVEGFERVLREHPRLWPEQVVVCLKALGAAVEVEVMAWFQVADGAAFQLCRQEVLLRFMDVVEEAGLRLASPSPAILIAGPSLARD